MPYITTERVAEIRTQIKKEFPGYKFSIRRSSSSSGIHCNILAAPIDFTDEEKTRYNINEYYIRQHWQHRPEIMEVFLKLKEIMTASNGKEGSEHHIQHVDSDYGSIPNYYFYIEVGTYERPFQFIPNNQKPQTDGSINSSTERPAEDCTTAQRS